MYLERMAGKPISFCNQASPGEVSATDHPFLSLDASRSEELSAGATADHNAPFPFPNIQQQAAVVQLKDIDEDRLFAFLTVIRSIDGGLIYRLTPGGLSSDQLHALSVLRDCLDSDISFWLQCNLLSCK